MKGNWKYWEKRNICILIARLCIEKIRKRKMRKSTGKIEKIEKNAGVKMPLLSSPLNSAWALPNLFVLRLHIPVFLILLMYPPHVFFSYTLSHLLQKKKKERERKEEKGIVQRECVGVCQRTREKEKSVVEWRCDIPARRRSSSARSYPLSTT